MVRSIPPKTTLDKLRERAKGPAADISVKQRGSFKAFKKPRKWMYETKPDFKRLIKEPLIDVFNEASEVRIIIDLGSFSRGEVDIDIKTDRYVITAVRGKETFKEEILFPNDVDAANTEEHFKNGILELVLPRKERKRPAGKEII
ncbi:MAG: Hsp20 family protein [Deltaproteobacteria bacterium]|nr:Hsp20 family protein [Deltaproteobacteria bacterium]